MMSLDQELARLVKNNTVNEVDALEKCQDKTEFYRYLTAMGGQSVITREGVIG
jgi:twitching motility protein PilT